MNVDIKKAMELLSSMTDKVTIYGRDFYVSPAVRAYIESLEERLAALKKDFPEKLDSQSYLVVNTNHLEYMISFNDIINKYDYDLEREYGPKDR